MELCVVLCPECKRVWELPSFPFPLLPNNFFVCQSIGKFREYEKRGSLKKLKFLEHYPSFCRDMCA